ncbi:hypothetical protein LguiA_002301 [Lonicera macranthoides]
MDGKLKGLELKKEIGGHEGELVKIIGDKVLEFLKQNSKHEDTDLVGVHSRKEKMEELLTIHTDAIWVIGIHGMGGLDDYKEGIRKIKDVVHTKKVVIVLDIVDEKSQIKRFAGSYEWFGAGSRIIITTRNKESRPNFDTRTTSRIVDNAHEVLRIVLWPIKPHYYVHWIMVLRVIHEWSDYEDKVTELADRQ